MGKTGGKGYKEELQEQYLIIFRCAPMTIDNFKAIREILLLLERSMDDAILDTSIISSRTLGISENRLKAILIMLIEEGFIAGASVDKSRHGSVVVCDVEYTHITLAGLEYLRDNT